MSGRKPQPRFLLTGFGPFAGVADNPTQILMERLCECRKRKGCELHTLVLPTVYSQAGSMIVTEIERLQPAYVLCLGVAPGPGLRLERRARNLDNASLSDAAGQVQRGPIIEGGKDWLRNSLDLPAIRASLLTQGFPLKHSNDAGGYLCNNVFYHACLAAARLEPRARCGFIHVPPAESLPLERQELAVRLMIRASLIADGHLKGTTAG